MMKKEATVLKRSKSTALLTATVNFVRFFLTYLVSDYN